MILVETFVAGAPKTKGSMKVRNRATGAMKESVIGSSNWRALIAAAVRDDIARRHCSGGSRGMACEHRAPFNCGAVAPYAGAVAVTVTAYLPPPGTWWMDGLVARLWESFRWPTWNQAGDLDKLVRNVLDALGSKSRNAKMNGGAIVDDNLVCRIVAEKHTGGGDTRPQGVLIRVETL